jgi:hypothetical protein
MSSRVALHMLLINFFRKFGFSAKETQKARDNLPRESFTPVSLRISVIVLFIMDFMRSFILYDVLCVYFRSVVIRLISDLPFDIVSINYVRIESQFWQ